MGKELIVVEQIKFSHRVTNEIIILESTGSR